ncbi:hypothetical protein [Terriglobus albidus]|uniref:hypothetical protein n=1 Tax=Terriglobus albidus TaxID=1592106 RepID=UPI00164D22FB|nr:hypothetical protein [Terriglobus albidus]
MSRFWDLGRTIRATREPSFICHPAGVRAISYVALATATISTRRAKPETPTMDGGVELGAIFSSPVLVHRPGPASYVSP